MTNRKTRGYRRARRIHAKRKYVNNHLKRRPDFYIGFLTGFYTVLAIVLTIGTWMFEYALQYKYGLITASAVIGWGIASFIGMVVLMMILMYSMPTIMWRLMWKSKKSREKYPDWVTDVERIDKRRK